jgi:two-component sensor histidine kinase
MPRLDSMYLDVPGLRPGSFGAYAFAFLCTAIATAVRIGIDPYVDGVPFITFFPAVIITTLISGFGAGVFCVVVSAAAADFFVISPHLALYIERSADAADLILFILEALFYVILITGLRLTLERYRDLSHNLELRVKERSAALHESQERLKAVVAELQHRTRNLISVVGTIAKRTLKTSETFDDFEASFQDRLEVLGRTQALLFRTEAGGQVTFDELIDTELAAQPIRVGGNASVTLDGPKGVGLRSGAVQPLVMALHELTTNALKYGALKQPNGHLTVTWRLESLGESGSWLHLDWKESGVDVPPLGANPQGTGQGRQLIERVLPYQFDAQTMFTMEADGVHCTISLPASDQMTNSYQPSSA